MVLQQATDAAFSAKAINKQVAAQENYAKELATLRSQRLEYERSWLTYVQSLADKFTEQVAEKRQVVANYAEREDQLELLVKQAKAQELAMAAGPEALQDQKAEDLEMAVTAPEQSLPDPWPEPHAKARKIEDTLVTALKSASKEACQDLQKVKRENSRTPRRAKDARDAQDDMESIASSQENAIDPSGDHKPPAATAPSINLVVVDLKYPNRPADEPQGTLRALRSTDDRLDSFVNARDV